MKRYEELISRILHFAEIDFRHLRKGEWLDLQEELVCDFLGWPERRQNEVTPDTLIPIQTVLRERVLPAIVREMHYARNPEELPPLLDRMKEYGDENAYISKTEGPPGGIAMHFALIPQDAPIEVLIPMLGGDVRPFLRNADLRTSFFFSLAVLFSKLDMERLRRCPFCTRLFYAEHGRMEYCSARCSNLERTRRHRKALNTLFGNKKDSQAVQQEDGEQPAQPIRIRLNPAGTQREKQRTHKKPKRKEV